MEFLGLVVPVVAAGGWLWWIQQMDRGEREPWRLIFKTAGAGAAAGLAALIALVVLLMVLPEESGIGGALMLMAPVHMIAIAAVVYFVPYRWAEWNEPFDGLVYGGAAGIGYGFVYTLIALVDSPALGVRSAVFSMPLYMLAGLITGHYLSQVRFQAGSARKRPLIMAGLFLIGIALAEGVGGEVMGRANPVASAVVYASNTLGWVMAMHAMDVKGRASQYHPDNRRAPVAHTGCPRCQTPYLVGASFCNGCGAPATEREEIRA